MGSLIRIRDNVPPEMLKSLYHTLFESYLSYGITVWGEASQSHLSPLLKVQKQCCRILFGDREAYNNKFKTCARARPYKEQKLRPDHFKKENTKPLMAKYSILSMQNLYYYHCMLMCLKVIKFRSPMPLYSLFHFSHRKPTLMILPKDQKSLAFRMGKIWNKAINTIKIPDLAVSVASVKSASKKHLLERQCQNDPTEWDKSNFKGF